MSDLDAIREGLGKAVPFNTHLGIEVTALSPGEATAVLPERGETANHIGSQHAGALFSVAEAASGAALVGAIADGLEHVTPLVSRCEIRYSRLAKGRIEAAARLADDGAGLLARARAEGSASTNAVVTLRDSADQEVATFTADWHLRYNPPAEG